MHTSLTRLRNTISISSLISQRRLGNRLGRQYAINGQSADYPKRVATVLILPFSLPSPPLFLPLPHRGVAFSRREEQPGELSPYTVQTNKNKFDRIHKHGGRPAHLIARTRFYGALTQRPRPLCIRYLYWRKCALNIQFAALLIGASILRAIFVVHSIL